MSAGELGFLTGGVVMALLFAYITLFVSKLSSKNKTITKGGMIAAFAASFLPFLLSPSALNATAGIIVSIFIFWRYDGKTGSAETK